MQEQSISRATFFTADMDRATLEHLAMSPRKFAARLEASGSVDVYPYSERILQDRISEEDTTTLSIRFSGAYDEIFLAPGGRFLITSQRVAIPGVCNVVKLWDLGICGQDRIRLLARTILDKTTLVNLRYFSAISGGMGFYLVSESSGPYVPRTSCLW